MESRLSLVLAALTLVLVAARPSAAQAAEPIVGEWTVVGGEGDGQKIVFRADGTASLAGTEVRWQLVGAGVVRCSAGGQSLDFGYKVEGNQLSLTADGETVLCRRGGGAPPAPQPTELPEAPPAPQPVPAPPNPLAPPAPPTAPRFAREFTGEAIALTLTGSSETGYEGELKYGASVFPVTAKSEGNRLTGEFTSGGKSFPLEGTLNGDRLELTSGGNTFVLTGKPVAAPVNPLAGGDTPPAPNPLAPGGGDTPEPVPAPNAPDPLVGAYAGPAERYEHPRGYYSFDMPAGWTVFRDGDDGLLLNPGLKPEDNLDALIIVGHGQLEPAEQNRPINEVVDAGEAELLAELRKQGIDMQPAGRKSTAVLLGNVPGAVQMWKGKNARGQELSVWFGGVTKREFYLSVLSIMVAGKEDAFLPKVKRIFATMAPKPPERNRAAEQALAGKTFFQIESNPSGTFSTTYAFRSGNAVHKESIFSGGGMSTDTSDNGQFEVVGDQIFIYFKDGQKTATLVVKNDAITGIRFGDTVYNLK